MPFDEDALSSLRIDRGAQSEPERSKPMYLWLIGAGLSIVVASGFRGLLREEAVVIETTAVKISSPRGSSTASVLTGAGYVVARRQATVSAKVIGKVKEIYIEEGMAVKAGQLLAKLDETSTQPQYDLAQRQLEAKRANLAEVEVRVAEAERSLQRIEQLRADMLVSESQLDKAQSEVQALRARLESLVSEVKVAEGTLRVRAQDLDDLLVRAPFDGVIVSKDAQPGEIVSPMSAGGAFTRTGIATIVDMESREIEVDVNEAFIGRVRAGQRTEAVLDAYPDWVIAGQVIGVVPTADRQKATLRVRIGVDNLDPRILPEMAVKVSFLHHAEEQASAGAATRLGVAAAAVDKQGATSNVWRVTDERVQPVIVRVGAEREGQVEVISGLNAGDTVVRRPAASLGYRTKVIEAAAAALNPE